LKFNMAARVHNVLSLRTIHAMFTLN
jgi:hypothetical protein